MNNTSDTNRKILEMLQEQGWTEQLQHPEWLARSISIEAAELLECYQWSDEPSDPQAVLDELADVMIYALQMAMALGQDMDALIERKLEINAQRKKAAT